MHLKRNKTAHLVQFCVFALMNIQFGMVLLKRVEYKVVSVQIDSFSTCSVISNSLKVLVQSC